MSFPTISVVMTVYNTSSYLTNSVESILNQTFEDFEFIIVDDCSTDDSWSILSDYAKRDLRIILQRNQENLGPAQSSNKGLAIAKGEYIARFDSDDVSLPTRLQEQLNYMERHPSVALITTAVDYINDNGDHIGKYIPPIDPIMTRWHQIFGSPLRHPTAFWRRQLISDLIGQYNSDFRYALDYEFFTRVCHSVTVHALSGSLVKMRQRSSSVTFSKRQLQDSFAASITYQQFDFYFQGSPLTQAEKCDLRALLRRHSPLQQKEFSQLCSGRFNKAVNNYVQLFENFCSIHHQEIDTKRINLLHTELERHLPALIQHGLQNRWKKISFSLVLSYLKRYPNRMLSTLKTLFSYFGYYSLRSIKPLDQLLNNIRSIYYKNLRRKQFS
ncbi:MAG: glycosyltransferase family 2 protein [Cyanothece sp. SIO1E1]|nr:glycosyltransferase family 2 protein [Cyanothece sp. SIO1E1]